MAEEETGQRSQIWTNSTDNVEEFIYAQRRENRRKQRGRDEYIDNEHDQQRSKKKTKVTEAGDVKLLACPYHQRDHRRLYKHRACNGPGWNSISRLKEHLYRTHFAHRCHRCKSRFENSSQLENHYQYPIPCVPSQHATDPMEGFNDAQREKLKCRNVKDWKHIYRILFPDDHEMSIPSPYYSNAITISAVLDRFETDYQRAVERLIPDRLNSILAGYHSRPGPAIQGDILAVVSDVHSTVIQSMRQRTVGMVLDSSDLSSHSTISAVSASRMEPNLYSPANYWGGYVNSLLLEDGSTQDAGPNLELDTSNTLLPGGAPLELQSGLLDIYDLV
ncbi:hypothetical protein F5Y05DRAFT_415684 [Hypoxylon sp. FL0543]|nr:hypothetical protein F5Y05DRAFT_415684 [Hypoxylon sp. FL0543]